MSRNWLHCDPVSCAAARVAVQGSARLSRGAGEDLVAATVRLCRELDGGVLPIQVRPRSGKTYVGTRAILASATASGRVHGRKPHVTVARVGLPTTHRGL